jgi:hypothetical protein
MSSFVDLTDKSFGRLTVIERVENRGKHPRYLCKCACGAEKVFYASNLVNGLSTSCGCYRKEKLKDDKLIDLTGKRFGRLVVIGLDPKKAATRLYYWKCKCDCGNECVVYGGHLKDGHTSSCGCYNKEKITEARLVDLTGQRFGKLLVLKRLDTYYAPGGASSPRWLCKCDCGNTIEVLGASLRNGTSSCGCVNSLGETLLTAILLENNISFKKQYSLIDLRSDKNRKLFFDFCIFENDSIKCLIEFQGRQHFKYDKNWKQTEADFNAAQKRDELKRSYCKNNHIPLVEIPYWDLSKLDYGYLKSKIEVSLQEVARCTSN